MKNWKINANKIKMYLTTQIATIRTFLDSECRPQCVIWTIRMKRDRPSATIQSMQSLFVSSIVTIREFVAWKNVNINLWTLNFSINFFIGLCSECWGTFVNFDPGAAAVSETFFYFWKIDTFFHVNCHFTSVFVFWIQLLFYSEFSWIWND